MGFKKIIASALSAAVLLSAMAIPAFAADTLALQASKTEAAAGETVTISLPMDSANTYPVGAASVTGLTFDSDAFEYVGATSDFSNVIGPEAGTASPLNMSWMKFDSVRATGDLMVFTFRVKEGAAGGAKEFSIESIQITAADNDVTDLSPTTITPVSVTVKAPEKLVMGDVTIEGTTASWDAVTNATGYTVKLTKGETELYNKTITGTSFDFTKYVTETANYTVSVVAKGNGGLYLDSDEKTAAEEIKVDAAITPTEKDYVMGSGGFDVTMTLNGNTLTQIAKSDAPLAADSDYTVAGNVVHINEAVLEAPATSLVFTFSNEQTITLTVNVTAAASSATLVLAERANEDTYVNDDTVPNDGSNDGLIVVTGGDEPIANFIGAQFTLNNTAAVGYDAVEYEIVPADGYALLYDADADMYEINVKPVDGSEPSISEAQAGKGIVIGKLVRKGAYGQGVITAGNITMTVEKSDNSYATLTAQSFSFQYNIPEPAENLNINVDFSKLPTVTANDADYQSMKITLYSARLGNVELALGDGVTYTSADGKITASVTASENQYAVLFENLPAFDAYTVSISGDGYRDAKAQFVLNEETTVNFWNNANDSDRIFISKEVSGTEQMVSKNFLAGDIIMNNVIDLYDLSAVSSYYGKKSLTADDAQYIQYDLNRDTKIDIIDITMLLAGWAE